MAQRPKEPLRPLTADERAELRRGARASSAPAGRVARAKALLAVADGARFAEAAPAVGRRSGDAVAHLGARFNRLGPAALDASHGGGPPVRYGPDERERSRREFRRKPDRAADGTASWSLATRQRALRRGPDPLPTVSTATILHGLWEAGDAGQAARTWCHTGTAKRRRKDGTVVDVVDPQAAPQKS